MKAVVLVNMGSVSSQKEMKRFLKNMFVDKAIINAPYFVRLFLSFFISNFRYRHAWEKHQTIGGSPLSEAMQKISTELSLLLNHEYLIYIAYSYTPPLLNHQINNIKKQGVHTILILPMYPHYCNSTTGSIQFQLQNIKQKFPQLTIQLIKEYYYNKTFNRFWVSLISEKIKSNGYTKPYLLFTAHAIPQKQIQYGDPYIMSIQSQVKLIASALQLPHSLSFQSKIGRIKWVEPDTHTQLLSLYKKGIDEIIMIPISFITENLETRYDLDLDIIPFAKQVGIKNIDRVKLPFSHPLLIQTFYELIRN